MRSVCHIFIFLLLAAFLLFVGLTPSARAASDFRAVICFGDSITFGVGATPETRWEADLQKLGAGRIRTINEGASGRTLADATSPRREGRYANGLQEPLPPDGTPTLAQDVVLRHPEAGWVVVFLGVNDLKDNRTDGADKGALALTRAEVLLGQVAPSGPRSRSSCAARPTSAWTWT